MHPDDSVRPKYTNASYKKEGLRQMASALRLKSKSDCQKSN